jgi:predicted GNAT family acetyltransferase
MYLQEAYEREEVLTPIHDFNRAACRASLARALERQIVLAAEEGGVLVGKAGTNARGFGVDQVGGVYTLPERRGRGVASALMAALLAEIGSSGKKPALFVKPTNAPARALYRSLGFEDIGDYRADYFEA